MNFSLGKNLENYVASLVASGPFNNASEVVRDALRLHQERQLKMAALKAELQLGFDDLDAGRVQSYDSADALADDIIRRGRDRLNAND